MNLSLILQPLRQTKLQIAINLLLAPVYALLTLFLPVCLVVFILQQITPTAPHIYGFLMMAFLFSLGAYLVLFYPLLLVSCLSLQHLHRFNVLSILIVSALASVLFAYLMDEENMMGAMFRFAVLILPTIGFFIFLTLRQHQKRIDHFS